MVTCRRTRALAPPTAWRLSPCRLHLRLAIDACSVPRQRRQALNTRAQSALPSSHARPALDLPLAGDVADDAVAGFREHQLHRPSLLGTPPHLPRCANGSAAIRPPPFSDQSDRSRDLAPETVLFARRYRLLPHTSTKGLSSVEIAALCAAARNPIDEAGARPEDRKPAQNHLCGPWFVFLRETSKPSALSAAKLERPTELLTHWVNGFWRARRACHGY